MNPSAVHTTVQTEEETVTIYCPDCRGRFEVPADAVCEGELVDCDLCGAEIEVMQEDPIKVRLYCEEYDF